VVAPESERRVWAARLVAPAAFFVAAIALVVLIQRGLEGGASATVDTTPVVNSPTTTGGTTTETKGRRIYRVRQGDTLESISAKFDTTVDDLLRLNPDVDPLALSPHQKIRVS
jgi:LysM repeat protein